MAADTGHNLKCDIDYPADLPVIRRADKRNLDPMGRHDNAGRTKCDLGGLICDNGRAIDRPKCD